MKKFMVIFLAVIMLVPTLAVGTPAASTTIQIPYATKVPKIDGKGDDEAWGKAYKETLNPTTAAKAGNFVEKRSNTSDAASADISVLWNEKGLYFKWVVDDPTQSFALDLPNSQLHSMDGVQVVLDPFYKRFASVKNCAFCFTFVPYTCPRGSGVGQVPVQSDGSVEPSWYEHWQWVGMNSSLGVEMASKLEGRPDDNDDGLDQIFLVSGYTIEAFIPVGALNLNGKDPTFTEKANIGIGFMLIDYLYDHSKFESAGGAAGGGAQASQVVYNFCMDYSNRKTDDGKPAKYNTAILVKEISDGPVEVTPYESLQSSIKLADEYIAKKDDYTESSIMILQKALDEAKKLTSSSSETECTAAQEKLGTAINGLLLKADDTLENLIKAAELLVTSYETETPPYTAESWKAFKDALAAAKELVAKKGFDEKSDEAKAAKKALEDARAALVEGNGSALVDLTELASAIEEAEKVKEADYTAESYQVLKTAIDNAEAVYTNANATKEEVDQATQALKDAYNNLKSVSASTDDANTGGFPWYIVLIVLGVLAIAAVVVILVLKKKKDAQPAIAETEAVTEDQPFEATETIEEETAESSEEAQGEDENK